MLDLKGEDKSLLPTVTHMKALAEIREKVTAALEDQQLDFDKDRFCFFLLGSLQLSLEEKRKIADKVGVVSKQKLQQLFSLWQENEKLLHKDFGKVSEVFDQALASGEIKAKDDYEGARAAAEHFNHPELLAMVYVYSDFIIPKLVESVKNAYELLLQQHESVTIYFYWGNLLEIHLQQYEEAEAAYRKAIELNETYAYPWSGLGYLLQNQLQRYEEAEAALREAIIIQHEDVSAYNGLAWMLFQQQKKLPEAIELAHRAVALDSNNLYALYILLVLLVSNQRWQEAMPLFKKFISEANPEFFEKIWPDIILLFQEIITIDQTESALNCLDETGAGERCRPLRQALMVIVSGNERYLNSVAPEIRDPSQKNVEQLRSCTK